MYILAHRGDQQTAIENTPEAFENLDRFKFSSEQTVLLGAEFDLQLIGDELYCYHDDDFDRLHPKFRGTLNVEAIEAINNGRSSIKIPTFEQILQIFNKLDSRFILNVELKSFELTLVIKVIDLIKKYQFTDRVILSSFGYHLVEYISIYHPEFKTGFLVRDLEDFKFLTRQNSWIKKITYVIFDAKEFLEADRDAINSLPHKLGVYTLDNKSYVTSEKMSQMKESYPNLDLFITDNMDLTLKNFSA
jgi:glycerophosphoryl diester phosphodiesterase